MQHDRETSNGPGTKVTIIGSVVNLVLITIKLATGIWGQSQALIADAVHSFSDLVTDVVVLFGLWQGRKPPDKEHHFGHARIETFASSAVGIALIITGGYLAFDGGSNIFHNISNTPTELALIGAGISIALKEVLYHYTAHIGRKMNSQLLLANAWHHRSDALSSVAVFFGVAGVRINPSWKILDSVAAVIVSFFIIKVGISILNNSLKEFTDTAPGKQVVQKIRQCALSINGVIDTHDLRVRTAGGLYQMEIHIVVDGHLTVFEGHNIAKAVEKCLISDINLIDHVIVHVDPALLPQCPPPDI